MIGNSLHGLLLRLAQLVSQNRSSRFKRLTHRCTLLRGYLANRIAGFFSLRSNGSLRLLSSRYTRLLRRLLNRSHRLGSLRADPSQHTFRLFGRLFRPIGARLYRSPIGCGNNRHLHQPAFDHLAASLHNDFQLIPAVAGTLLPVAKTFGYRQASIQQTRLRMATAVPYKQIIAVIPLLHGPEGHAHTVLIHRHHIQCKR
ncbi:hypothetical protein AC781_04825 [Akkermansia glycaniphila]|nr:hypothetical protein AC781_04825 [Akkermansia glycaniphila]